MDLEEEMHLVKFTETKKHLGVLRDNFSKYGDSNGALDK